MILCAGCRRNRVKCSGDRTRFKKVRQTWACGIVTLPTMCQAATGAQLSFLFRLTGLLGSVAKLQALQPSWYPYLFDLGCTPTRAVVPCRARVTLCESAFLRYKTSMAGFGRLAVLWEGIASISPVPHETDPLIRNCWQPWSS